MRPCREHPFPAIRAMASYPGRQPRRRRRSARPHGPGQPGSCQAHRINPGPVQYPGAARPTVSDGHAAAAERGAPRPARVPRSWHASGPMSYSTSDVMAGIDELLSRNKDKIPADQMEAQRKQLVQEVNAGIRQLLDHINDPNPGLEVDPQRRAIIQQLLRQQIETKLIYQGLPPHRSERSPAERRDCDHQAIRADGVEEAASSERTHESRQDLEWRLRARGSSLEREKRMFMERVVSQTVDPRANQAGQGSDPRADADLVSVASCRVREAGPSPLGRVDGLQLEIQQQQRGLRGCRPDGQPGAFRGAVGRSGQGPVERARRPATGGVRDWTTKGSLASEQVDRALFGLPVGQLSPIIESKSGYHIIRVTERQEPTRTPFLEAQKEVSEKIRQERTRKQYGEYVTRVRKQFPVWTIFDGPSAKPKAGDGEEPSRY